MHLDRRFLIIVGVSLLWGLLVSGLFYRMASASRNRPPEKTLVVAAQPLAPGSAIAADSVKLVRVPEEAFPKGAYSRLEDVMGRPVVSSIGPDEPVVDSRLAAKGSGFGVAPMIPSGMRAVSVRVNDVVGVAGFILPGMRVDVLVTGKPQGAEDPFTATVLQNVTVLSAGQRIEADGKSQAMSVAVVTLLVDPPQAESLTLAASEGHIQLVLRNSGDQNVTATSGRHWRDLWGHAVPAETPAPHPPAPVMRASLPPPHPAPPPAPAAQPPAAAPAPPAVHTVILLRGNQRSVETFPLEAGREGPVKLP